MIVKARRVITLDEKIRKAEVSVAAAKAKYDVVPDELEKLVVKRKQLDDKKVLDAYHVGDKTADEIIGFIQLAAPKADCGSRYRIAVPTGYTIEQGGIKCMMTLTQYKKVIKSLTRDELEAHLYFDITELYPVFIKQDGLDFSEAHALRNPVEHF